MSRLEQLEIRSLLATTVSASWDGDLIPPPGFGGEIAATSGNTLTLPDGTVLRVTGFAWDGPIIVSSTDNGASGELVGVSRLLVTVPSGRATPALFAAVPGDDVLGDVVLTTRGAGGSVLSTWTLKNTIIEQYQVGGTDGLNEGDTLTLSMADVKIAYTDSTAGTGQRTFDSRFDNDPGFGTADSFAPATLTLGDAQLDVLGFDWHTDMIVDGSGDVRQPAVLAGPGQFEITVAAGTATPALVYAFWKQTDLTAVLTQKLGTRSVSWTLDEPNLESLRIEADAKGQETIVLTLDVRDVTVSYTDGSTPVNHAPLANDDSAIAAVNTVTPITLVTNDSDPDGDLLSIKSVNLSGTIGTVSIADGRTVLYSAPESFFLGGAGVDSFTYTVRDSQGAEDTATVTITANKFPVASFTISDVAGDGTSGSRAPRTVLLDPVGSSDPDGDPLTYRWTFGDGSFAVTTTGAVTHTYNTVGTFIVTLTVTDSHGSSNLFLTLDVVATRGTASGTVFEDVNGNGKRDAGEPTSGGHTVFVDRNQNGVLDVGEPSQTVPLSGAYSFADVGPGTEQVRLRPLAGAMVTSPSNGLQTISFSQSIQVTGKDFGVFRPGSIDGVLFVDRNGDGVQNLNEPVRGGRQVYLDLDNDNVRDANERIATTGADGIYSFSQVVGPGSPSVRPVSLATGEYVTNPGGRVLASMPSGGSLTRQNLGVATRGTVSGTVFLDLDADGIFDAGEKGMAGRSVSAYQDQNNNKKFDTGEPTVTTVTDSMGNYSLTRLLEPGTWRVSHVLSGGWVASSPASNTHDLAVTSGSTFTPRNFSGFVPASIAGVVYEDANGNGSRDAGESGLGNWTVYLDLDRNGFRTRNEPTQVTSDSADQRGTFRFEGLKPGTYQVRQLLERGYATGQAGWRTTLISSQAVDAAFANYQPVSLEGTVFGDSDGDGQRDPGEAGLPGRVVILERVLPSGAIVAVESIGITSLRGVYQFRNLAPGSYRVRMFTHDRVTGPLGGVHDLALFSGLTAESRDFGLQNSRRERNRK